MEQTLGKRIVSHRKRLGMTQDQLAEKLGVTAQAVSKWENDQSCPDISVLPRLAEIFGITTDELLGHQPQKVYEAEVVEETPDDYNDGFHFQKGNWNFHWDNGRKAAVCFAVLVLTVGVLYLLSQVLVWDLSFWDILWPTALLVFGLFGLFPRFSFFRLGCTVLGGYFLISKIAPLPVDLDGGIIFAVIILLFGFSLLVDALRKSKKPRFRMNYTDNSNRSRKATTNNFETTDTAFSFDASFGENNQRIDLPNLERGEINTSFGEYTVDLSGVETVTDDCTIDANCSFGQLTILVPRRFQVKPVTSTAFAGFTSEGQPDDFPEGKILLDANASFGEIKLIYI